jgi:selenocysteine lyase/cysteine desulfurase
MQRKYGNHLFGLSVNDRGVARGLFGVDEFREVQGKELLERLRGTRIGKNLMVPTVNGTVRSIHLDNSASTPTFLPAWDAFRRSLSLSESMRGKIAEEVSRICLDYLGASGSSYEVVFTSNATEAINVVAESLIREGSGEWQQVIVGSLLEHSSNDLPWRKIPDLTFIRLSVNGHGIFDLDELTQHLREYNQEGKHGRKRVRMVALSGASNVLGVCNDLAAISSIVHQYGAELLVDGAQLVPHRKVEMGASGIDYLAFSAHKVYAPFGTGVLVVRKGLLNFSGHQMERIRSSGEENTAGIAALGKVLSILDRIGMPLIENEEQKLTERALEQLSRIKGLKIYGIQEKESPDFERKLGVIAFNMERVLSFRVGKELAFRDGIGVRVGCHCAHITVKHILQVSQGLERFQHLIQKLLPALQFPGVVRMSLGLANSDEDVDRLMEGLTRISSAGGKKNRSLKLGSLETFYRIQSERVFGQL